MPHNFDKNECFVALIARARLSKLWQRIIMGAFAISATSAFAQISNQAETPTAVQGAFTLSSSLGVDLLENDNIFQSATSGMQSKISMLRPTIQLQFEPSRQRFEFGYDGEFAWYDESSNDDYDDHALQAGAFLQLGRRSALDVVASYSDDHDNRGVNRTQGIDFNSEEFPTEPDQFTTAQLRSRYEFGADTSRGLLAFEVSSQELKYNTSREFTQRFDRKTSFGEATFGVRVQPDTSLQLRLRATDIAYSQSQNLDSREYRYLVGVQWDATARTSGSILIGDVDKEYDDPTRPDFSAANWEVSVNWAPRTYSQINFSTQRFPNESNTTFGDVLDTQTYTMSWSHEWNDRLSSVISISTRDQEFREDIQSPQQTSEQFSLALGYLMRPWLRWEFSANLDSRDSNNELFVFDARILRIGARIIF